MRLIQKLALRKSQNHQTFKYLLYSIYLNAALILEPYPRGPRAKTDRVLEARAAHMHCGKMPLDPAPLQNFSNISIYFDYSYEFNPTNI